MKSALNAAAIGAWLVWAGWILLDEISRGYAGASAPTHGEVGFAVVLVVLLAVVGSVIASRSTDGPRGSALAALPFLFVLVGHGLLVARQGDARRRRRAADEERARVVQARFDELDAAFTYRGAFEIDDTVVASILVIDEEARSIARVDREPLSLVTFCMGALEGQTLWLSPDLDLHDYVDASGATVYDRFTIVADPAGPPTDCNHERYDF